MAAKVTNVVYAVLSLLLVVAAVLALVSGSQRSTSNRLLAAGLVATFALDIVATMVTAGLLGNDMRLYVAPFAFIFGCAGLLHPSVVFLTSRPSDPTLMRRLTSRRIMTLALALITPPTLIVIGLARGDASDLVLPGIASLALAPLVVTRLGRLVRQNEELAALESSLRAVGERLVSAETTDDVARIITIGAEQVLRRGFITGGLVLDPRSDDGLERAVGLSEQVSGTPGRPRGTPAAVERNADDAACAGRGRSTRWPGWWWSRARSSLR